MIEDIYWLISTLISLYIGVLIIGAVLSWLVAFNVVNTRHPVVSMIGRTVENLTEPVLRPIRSVLPNLGGIDISPVLLIILLMFADRLIARFLGWLAYG